MNTKSKEKVRLSEDEAIDISIRKWKKLKGVKSEKDIDLIHLEYKIYINNCPLCEMFFYERSQELEFCVGCPLVIINGNYDNSISGCIQIGHPFDDWLYAIDCKEFEEVENHRLRVLKLLEKAKDER